KLGKFARDFLDHLLDQEVSKRDAAEAALAIRDRIERGGRGFLGVERRADAVQDRRNRARNAARERNLDENQGLVDERRMEEGVAAAIRRVDARPQVVP